MKHPTARVSGSATGSPWSTDSRASLRSRRLGLGPRLAEIGIPVVDASPVDELSAGVEDGRFRSDPGAREADQVMMGITKDLSRNLIFLRVPPDGLGLFLRIHVDEPKPHSTGRERLMQPPQLGRIPIGDGTVAAHEQKNAGRGPRPRAGSTPLAGEVRQVQLRRARTAAPKRSRRSPSRPPCRTGAIPSSSRANSYTTRLRMRTGSGAWSGGVPGADRDRRLSRRRHAKATIGVENTGRLKDAPPLLLDWHR